MNRIKDFLLGIFVFSSIIIIVFIIISFVNTKRYTELSDKESNIEKYEYLRVKVNDLEDSECKNYLESYIDLVNKGKFDGIVRLKDIKEYYYNYPTLSYYDDALKKCNITKDELKEKNTDEEYISVMAIPNTLLDKYMFAYEINLKDPLRKAMEPNEDNLLYSIIRYNQIAILADYLEIIESKEVNNE